MPKVEQYGGQKVQTQVVARPQRQSRPDPRLQLTKGVSQLGQGIKAMGDRWDKEDAESALNNFEREKNDLLYNPETGYMNSQGRDAHERVEPTNEFLRKLRDKYAETLSGNARDAFSGAAEKHITRTEADIFRHSSRGLKAFESSNRKDEVENTYESAALNWADESVLKIDRERGRQAIIDQNEAAGTSPTEALQTYESNFAEASIKSAIIVSPEQGRKKLAQYEGKLEGNKKLMLEGLIAAQEKKVEVRVDGARAVQYSNALLAASGGSGSGAVKLANEDENLQKNPKLLELTRKQIRTDVDRRDHFKEVESDEAREALTKMSQESSMSLAEVAASADGPATLAKLSPKEVEMIMSGKSAGIRTDPSTAEELNRMSTEELKKASLSYYWQRLSPEDYNEFKTSVDKALIGQRDEAGRNRQTILLGQINDTFGKGKRNTANEARAQISYGLVKDAAKLEKESLGRELTIEEYTNLTEKTLSKVVVEGTIWNTDYDLGDVKPGDIKDARQTLRELGVAPTPRRIEEIDDIRDAVVALQDQKATPDEIKTTMKWMSDQGLKITPDNVEKVWARSKQAPQYIAALPET